MSPCSSRTQTPSLTSIAGNRITPTPSIQTIPNQVPLRLPLQEISDQLEAQPLALLRMELGADEGVAADHGGNRTAIVRLGHEIGALGDAEVERVHKIGVQALRSHSDALKQRMRAALIERVPAHMGNLQARIGGRDAIDLAGNPAEPLHHFIFAAALG